LSQPNIIEPKFTGKGRGSCLDMTQEQRVSGWLAANKSLLEYGEKEMTASIPYPTWTA
jgi:hypothetical protein